MNPKVKKALTQSLLALADDELILAHRDSEWTGHAPILEEDIAFANIAQDELGHAIIWYSLLADITGDNPDRLVFFRDAPAYQNIQLVELPKGDWALSMLRQYLFDTAEMVRLEQLVQSRYPPLASAAAKIRKEELYHYRHTQAWVRRLSLGTAESHRRTQDALHALWPYTFQLFTPLPEETLLIEDGYIPEPVLLRAAWEQHVLTFLQDAQLVVPTQCTPVTVPRDQHTDHLVLLLREMQEVARLDSQAQW
jgi:ring-1,2-phenylacetyl-CoA epoxidase subunit PaaC